MDAIEVACVARSSLLLSSLNVPYRVSPNAADECRHIAAQYKPKAQYSAGDTYKYLEESYREQADAYGKEGASGPV
jgi:hypothetical protein